MRERALWKFRIIPHLDRWRDFDHVLHGLPLRNGGWCFPHAQARQACQIQMFNKKTSTNNRNSNTNNNIIFKNRNSNVEDFALPGWNFRGLITPDPSTKKSASTCPFTNCNCFSGVADSPGRSKSSENDNKSLGIWYLMKSLETPISRQSRTDLPNMVNTPGNGKEKTGTINMDQHGKRRHDMAPWQVFIPGS